MELPQRKSIRLSGYDYSQAGFYFITICTQDRRCLFGSIVGADQCVRPIQDLEEGIETTLPVLKKELTFLPTAYLWRERTFWPDDELESLRCQQF